MLMATVDGFSSENGKELKQTPVDKHAFSRFKSPEQSQREEEQSALFVRALNETAVSEHLADRVIFVQAKTEGENLASLLALVAILLCPKSAAVGIDYDLPLLACCASVLLGFIIWLSVLLLPASTAKIQVVRVVDAQKLIHHLDTCTGIVTALTAHGRSRPH